MPTDADPQSTVNDPQRRSPTVIRVAVVGYGNLGRGVVHSVTQQPDMELVGVYTRRDPQGIDLGALGIESIRSVPVRHLDELAAHAATIDVAVLCGGSKDDLPQQGPDLLRWVNTVDSFDTHADIPDYFATMDGAARESAHVATIAVGWDPGLFSLQRMLSEAVLPQGETVTFWGPGLSQGHSDAIRRVEGVAAGVQYTVPRPSVLEAARAGDAVSNAATDRHERRCFVVLEPGANPDAVREAIVTMPNYFVGYETSVTFISAEELAAEHAAMPHGGVVIRSGGTADGTTQRIDFTLALESNPAFTASVLVAYARATHRIAQRGEPGAYTLYDIAPGLLSPRSAAELRRDLL